MVEKIDPFLEHRLALGRNHRVLRSIDIQQNPEAQVEANKELPNPTLEGTIEEFGWSEKSVANIIDAIDTGKIKVEFLDGDQIRLELLPLTTLPEELGHVSELEVVKSNLVNGVIFGSQEKDTFTYLQTTDFAVEGYMDDEEHGKQYGRVYVDSAALLEKRNVYLDPESLHITDYEYGYAFCVKGGVPFNAIKRVEVIMAKKLPTPALPDDSNWIEDVDAYVAQQTAKLKEYLTTKIKKS
jgi:hypothetical protein